MKLIILYGPPAVGKLTIAEALVVRTGYKIFQNNPTVHAVAPIFEFGTPEFIRTLHRVRLTMFEEIAQSNLGGIIYTFCYDPNDEAGLTEIITTVERAGGTVHLVQLTCPKPVLIERIENESRKQHGKLMSQERLQEMFEIYDLFESYPLRESLKIDTLETIIEESVGLILKEMNN